MRRTHAREPAGNDFAALFAALVGQGLTDLLTSLHSLPAGVIIESKFVPDTGMERSTSDGTFEKEPTMPSRLAAAPRLAAQFAAAFLALLTTADATDTNKPKAPGLGDPGQLKAIEIETGRVKDGMVTIAGRDAGQQGQMDVEHVLLAHVIAKLADRLEVGERFDVSDRPADFDDDDLGLLLARNPVDPLLDLVRHVGNDLDGRSEVVAAPFLRDDGVVDLPSGQVRRPSDIAVDEALVMAEVEVGFGSVFGHEDLAVLIGRHRPRVDVQVGIHLERGDRETPRGEDAAKGSGSDAFAERGSDPSGHEHELRHRLDLRGFSDSTEVALVSPALD